MCAEMLREEVKKAIPRLMCCKALAIDGIISETLTLSLIGKFQ